MLWESNNKQICGYMNSVQSQDPIYTTAHAEIFLPCHFHVSMSAMSGISLNKLTN